MAKVRKPDNVEVHARNPFPGEGVRRNLQHGVGGVRLNHECQECVNFVGFGSGQTRGIRVARNNALGRRAESRCCPQLPEEGIQQVGNGRLAVRTGDTEGCQ